MAKTTTGKATSPSTGTRLLISSAANMPNNTPSQTHARLAMPLPIDAGRVKKATQPTNMAHSGKAKLTLAKAAAAATVAAMRLKPRNWNCDAGGVAVGSDVLVLMVSDLE